jgi:hypothetical protein
MSREIYGSPGAITSSTTSSPVVTYINRANTILSDLLTVGAKGKKIAINRLAVLEQLIRLDIVAAKKPQ